MSWDPGGGRDVSWLAYAALAGAVVGVWVLILLFTLFGSAD